MTDYVLHVSCYAGLVPGARHFRGRVEGPSPESCHGGTMFSNLGHTCELGHPLPGRVSWEVEAAWSEERYERWAARNFEGDHQPGQFASEQDVINTARARFTGELPARWWEDTPVTGQPGDRLWAGWVAREQDKAMTEENWGTVIAEIPAGEQETGTGDGT
jgi:hypothetical protein